MIDNVIFSSENNNLEINHLFTVDNYLTIQIKIRSGEFTGSGNFCISKETLVLVIKTLSKLLDDLNGTCTINDYDTDAFLLLSVDQYGHVVIKGQIGGSHQDNFMCFKSSMDQTVLNNLIKLFKRFL